MDSAGIAYVAGVTDSRDLRTVNAFQTMLNGNGDTNRLDAFVAKINSSVFGADGLLYSSYLGGSNDDTTTGIALGTNGTVYVTGITLSPDFPMQNPFDSTLNLNNETTAFDSFVTKLATGISGSAGGSEGNVPRRSRQHRAAGPRAGRQDSRRGAGLLIAAAFRRRRAVRAQLS